MNPVAAGAIIWLCTLGLTIAQSFDSALGASAASVAQDRSRYAGTLDQHAAIDYRGRSLRELDLQTRLFKYRCSYMIYSPAFDGLPGEARSAVVAQLRERIADPETLAVLDGTKAGWR